MYKSLQKGLFTKLSEREFKVAFMIVNGKRTTDIASELAVKNNTVSTFKRNIYFKMGVSSSIELFKLAVREGVCVMSA